MSAKKSFIEPRTLIYILIVILIIAGIAYYVLTYEPSDVLTVSQVISQKEGLIGDTIKVEGIYYSEEEDLLSSTYISDANPVYTNTIRLNLTQIGNETNVVEDQKYIVTGVLTQNQFGFIELRAIKIKES